MDRYAFIIVVDTLGKLLHFKNKCYKEAFEYCLKGFEILRYVTQINNENKNRSYNSRIYVNVEIDTGSFDEFNKYVKNVLSHYAYNDLDKFDKLFNIININNKTRSFPINIEQIFRGETIIHHIFQLHKQNKVLTKENKEFKAKIEQMEEKITALEYAPGSSKYYELEEDFKKLTKKL